MPLRYNANSSGAITVNGQGSGSTLAGNGLLLGDNSRRKVFHLTGFVQFTLATATLTMTAKWQVSNDNTTWIDFTHGTQNAAGVVLGTGTIAATSRALPAPDGVFGWRYARLVVVTGGTTGGASDALQISYGYRTSAL